MIKAELYMGNIFVIQKRQDSKPYDIYYDPNVPEVLQCRPLLEAFRTRVCDLLAEWTDHPTLKELMTVIDRMMSFPVTSPLMKFVTGLEVLIHKAEVSRVYGHRVTNWSLVG